MFELSSIAECRDDVDSKLALGRYRTVDGWLSRTLGCRNAKEWRPELEVMMSILKK